MNNMEGGIGSGVVLSTRCVLTAAHVAHDGLPEVTTSSGKTFSMTSVVSDEAEDISVLCSPVALDAPAVSFGPPPSLYDPVFTIGFPKGRHFFLTEGRWQAGDMISADCAPGNSGGGVFDASGHYLGFVDAVALTMVKQTPNLIYHMCDIVTVESIQKFLTTHVLG